MSGSDVPLSGMRAMLRLQGKAQPYHHMEETVHQPEILATVHMKNKLQEMVGFVTATSLILTSTRFHLPTHSSDIYAGLWFYMPHAGC